MNKIKKYDPFWGVDSFRRDMDRLFDSFFGNWPGEEYKGFWAPAVDVEETKDSIYVRVEIPGMKKEDIKIQAAGDTLVISGERRHSSEEKDRHFHRVERAYGKFQRALQLPVEVQSDKAKATYKDGILEVSFPKSEKAKAREIEIDVK
ncbi:Hsp20/alpha crystallin family protein [candidate division WOR-3 bacterium]|nr:Hsp20/alpha crystallin family protein [candidate division WOR-3 bacterium]